MRIASTLLADLSAQSVASPDSEICGLLLGTESWIAEARAASNVAADPGTAFEIDPQALIIALRAERAGGARVIGCYHSHPSGNAEPSERDAAAAEAGRLWLILARDQARLWRATVDGFAEVTLRVV